jgi:Ca2+-binding EF-hand superfamily protein
MVVPKAQFLRLPAARIDTRDPYKEVERAYSIFDSDREGCVVFGPLDSVAVELREHNRPRTNSMLL